ncbi:MAG: hypothetical protein FWC43_02800 [Planctomycetaceae bacterium]|nr:hypothetical protein [Planctomycetaceae bacterium]
MKTPPTDLDEGTIRRIDWQELCPAVLLPQAVSIATTFRVLWVASFGVLLTLFLAVLLKREYADFIPTHVSFVGSSLPGWETVLFPWKMMSNSLSNLFSFQDSLSLAWFLGVFIIWTICGAILTRTAATQITIGQYSRWSHLGKFLQWRLRSYFAAILIPVAGLAFCAIAVKIAGWLLMVPVVNVLVAILFPIVLFLGFCFAILGVGLLFGWPLAFAAVSVDGSDGFDAVSRTYSYVYQRPLQYLVYAVLGIAIGMIGYFFIAWFVDLAIFLIADWGNAPLAAFMVDRPETLASWILSFWCWCFQMVKIGFLFGYFWVCSTIIYVILRRSVDGTPIDEIRFPPNDQPGVQTIPALKTDEKGAPEIVIEKQE